MKWLNYAIPLFVVLFGFVLFYYRTGVAGGSLVAAILSAALVWISIIMLEWIAQVFTK